MNIHSNTNICLKFFVCYTHLLKIIRPLRNFRYIIWTSGFDISCLVYFSNVFLAINVIMKRKNNLKISPTNKQISDWKKRHVIQSVMKDIKTSIRYRTECLTLYRFKVHFLRLRRVWICANSIFEKDSNIRAIEISRILLTDLGNCRKEINSTWCYK